jgi:GGDEF domain-containing protein
MDSQNPRLLDRLQLRQRLTEELERSRRHNHAFGLLLFEAVTANDGMPLRQKMRAALNAIEAVVRGSDMIARPDQDMLAVVLVETDSNGTRDALFRIRQRIAHRAGTWRVTVMHFPEHAQTIGAMAFLDAA